MEDAWLEPVQWVRIDYRRRCTTERGGEGVRDTRALPAEMYYSCRRRKKSIYYNVPLVNYFLIPPLQKVAHLWLSAKDCWNKLPWDLLSFFLLGIKDGGVEGEE